MLQNTNLGDADAGLLKEAADSLEHRIERGELCAAESVLEAYPTLSQNRDSVLELMYLEWVLRFERNELLSVEEFFDRFPDYAGDFEKLVRVDEVVRGSIPESGVTLAEKAAIDFDPLTTQSRERAASHPSSANAIIIGGYTLERVIGRGGMGIVYQAKQHKLDRLVALKTIDFAGSLNPRTVARFRAEAELVARLQHPNIVQVYETGSHSGMPYFSMELVDGGTLATAITSGAMKPSLAAKLVEVLSRAMHYAHSQNIVHRDLKPANVLLARSDRAEALELSAGLSGRIRFEPKIVDFGLAKLLGSTSQRTITGAVLGTPSYMSPEQLSTDLGEIGPASDVYSLGAILYELLVGKPPFRAATAVETMQQVCHDEPSIPPSLRRKLPRDLVLICMTCLRKEPARRYASAADLANDLQHYLSGNPIQARPASFVETGLKWTKRHPSAAALMASVTMATVGMTMLWWRAETSSAAERLERVRAENLVYARNISLAHFEFHSNKVEECEKILASCTPAQRNWEWRYLDALCDDTLWVSPRSRLMSVALDISRDGRYVANGQAEWGSDDHEPISIWDVTTGEKTRELAGHPGGTLSVSFSPDGKNLASSGVVWAKAAKERQLGGVKVWNLTDGTERFTLCDKNAHVVRYSPDGQSIFAGLSSGVIVQFASETGKEIVRYASGSQFIADIAFHSGGKSFAACSRDGQVRVWDIATQKYTSYAFNLPDPRHLAWQPGTNILLVSCYGGEIKKFELSARTLKLLDTQGRNAGPLFAYSPDGQYLATSVFGEPTFITEVKTGRTISVLRGHNGHVRALTFDASGQHIATSGTDGSVRVWDLKQHTEYPLQRVITRDHAAAMAANPAKPEIALVSGYNRRRPRVLDPDELHRVVLFNLETRAQRDLDTRHSDWLTCVAYSPHGNRLLTGSLDHTINCIDRQSASVQLVLGGHSAPIVGIACIDDNRAISVDASGIAKTWQLESGESTQSWNTQQSSIVSLHIDTRREQAFLVSSNGSLSVWQLPSGQLIRRHQLNLEPSAAALSPDAVHFAIADSSGKVQLWHVSQLLGQNANAPRYVLNCHTDRITSLSFSPDNKRLLTGSRDESIKLIDVQTGYELIELDRAKGSKNIVLFTADGQQILRAEGEKLWNWAIKPSIDSGEIDPEKSRSAAIAWHRKQHSIAIGIESWFAAEFHCTRLHSFEPEEVEHLKSRALSRTYSMDFSGAESDLQLAMGLEEKFEYRIALARTQLRQRKQTAYRETCQKLFKDAVVKLLRPTNYEMAWTCCLSPDSGVDSQAILTVLDATRLVNTPLESLPKNIPLLDSAISIFESKSDSQAAMTKDTGGGSTDYNDGIYALTCYRAGKYALAAQHARKAIKKDLGAQHVHYLTLAMSLARQGKLKSADGALQQAKRWIDYFAGLNESGSATPRARNAASIAERNAVLRTTSIDYPILLDEAEKTLAELGVK